MKRERNWIKEFGADYRIPKEIDCLVDAGILIDVSWHNDACPSFTVSAHADSEDASEMIRLFVEHQQQDKREDADEKLRYVLISAGNELRYTGNSVDTVTAVVHELMSELDGQKLTRNDVLARIFADELRSTLTDREMNAVISRNDLSQSSYGCASHDFCDANMVMDRAYQRVFKREMELCADDDSNINVIEEQTDQWNRAWAKALIARFSFPDVSLERELIADWSSNSPSVTYHEFRDLVLSMLDVDIQLRDEEPDDWMEVLTSAEIRALCLHLGLYEFAE